MDVCVSVTSPQDTGSGRFLYVPSCGDDEDEDEGVTIRLQKSESEVKNLDGKQ